MLSNTTLKYNKFYDPKSKLASVNQRAQIILRLTTSTPCNCVLAELENEFLGSQNKTTI